MGYGGGIKKPNIDPEPMVEESELVPVWLEQHAGFSLKDTLQFVH
jgi:hypothetical protein